MDRRRTAPRGTMARRGGTGVFWDHTFFDRIRRVRPGVFQPGVPHPSKQRDPHQSFQRPVDVCGPARAVSGPNGGLAHVAGEPARVQHAWVSVRRHVHRPRRGVGSHQRHRSEPVRRPTRLHVLGSGVARGGANPDRGQRPPSVALGVAPCGEHAGMDLLHVRHRSPRLGVRGHDGAFDGDHRGDRRGGLRIGVFGLVRWPHAPGV